MHLRMGRCVGFCRAVERWAALTLRTRTGAFDGHIMRLYVNGRLAAERPSDAMVLDGGSVRIGSMRSGWGEWDGLVDEAASYRRALTAREVAEHYAVGTGAP